MPGGHGAAMERLFAGLADRTRLRLLNLMADQEVCVCFFVEILQAPQPKISRHLAYLRRSGVVEARRAGKWMHYRIAVPENPFARQVLADTLRWLSEYREMKRDKASLRRACCTPRKSPRLSGAPVPSTTDTLATELA
jgi:ArsR family transcriptional regulator, arsenate/arsenite/antimonite-responsive transcriptional repressor